MSNVSSSNRIAYVEPNDIYGKVGDSPMTPDYTDYCIYCNLIVEKTSRLKNSGSGVNSDNTFSIAYDSNNGKKGVEYTSFFSGYSKDYNFLTTDYSNIHFNSIKDRTFVEGLQITGIDISYVNRMSPLVTINMVDIRGGGIFAREEYVYKDSGINGLEKDNEGNIIDNIYSGFMSFPYPRYRLQVKGYYGRAVTYQLMCSNFTGKFDSNTGNFNITATFIGYEYGCLQDLPLSYVIAAPLTRTGRAYWNSKVDSNEWNLFMKEGKSHEKPVFLSDFFRKIDAAIGNEGTGDSLTKDIMDTALEEIVEEYGEKEAGIKNIVNLADKFVDSIRNINDVKIVESPYTGNNTYSSDISDSDRVIIVFSKNNNIKISDETVRLHTELGNAISEYSSKHPNDKVSLCSIPNNKTGKWDGNQNWESGEKELKIFLEKNNGIISGVSSVGGYKKIIRTDNYDGDVLNDNKMRMNIIGTKDTYPINSEQSYSIYDFIIKNCAKQCNDDIEYKYAGIIVMYKYFRITGIYDRLNRSKAEYERKQTEGSLIRITDVTGGLTPYIGNYYKLIFCHVDTFIHTLWKCADDIYNEINSGGRTPSKLGVYDNDITDVPIGIFNTGMSKGVIPPFPQIFSKDVNGSEGDATRKYGWVGDVSGEVEWREKSFVEEYYNAIRYIDSNTGDVPWIENKENSLNFNLLPCFVDDTMELDAYCKSIDGIAYYVSIMSELIIGSMNSGNMDNKECELIGSILAKRLFDKCENKNLLIKILKPQNVKERLCKMPFEDDNRTEPYRFEFALGENYNNKHKIFKKDTGNNVEYVYMKHNNESGIIPLDSVGKIDELKEKYVINYNTENGTLFTPKKIIDGDYVIDGNAKSFIQDINSVDKYSYVNSKMFSIWLDACNVSDMELNLNDYKTGGENIGKHNNKEFYGIINKYWKTGTNYQKYQNVSVEKLKESGIEIPDANGISDMSTNDLSKLVEKLKKIEY